MLYLSYWIMTINSVFRLARVQWPRAAWFPSTVWFKKKPCSHCQRFQHNDMKFMLSSGYIGTQHVQTHEIYACEFPALKYFRSCNCIWICLSFLFKCIDIMLSDILLRKKQWQTKHSFLYHIGSWTPKPLNTRQASYPLHCLCSSWRTTITAGSYPFYCSKKNCL